MRVHVLHPPITPPPTETKKVLLRISAAEFLTLFTIFDRWRSTHPPVPAPNLRTLPPRILCVHPAGLIVSDSAPSTACTPPSILLTLLGGADCIILSPPWATSGRGKTAVGASLAGASVPARYCAVALALFAGGRVTSVSFADSLDVCASPLPVWCW
ncbi:hypothetical protein GQ54DRAFT_175554 [Martensiomyces pterosporus]|nr:hypothetical protein GQ54DRAFT_175554 [Martensiomyces pterosporus]